jgi:hypothetical protein
MDADERRLISRRLNWSHLRRRRAVTFHEMAPIPGPSVSTALSALIGVHRRLISLL